MSDLKRYDFYCTLWDRRETQADAKEAQEGEYVLYEDVKALEKEHALLSREFATGEYVTIFHLSPAADKESAIHKKLIELGWTPPKESKPISVEQELPRELTDRECWLMSEALKYGFDSAAVNVDSGVNLNEWLNEIVADNGGTVEQLLAFNAPLSPQSSKQRLIPIEKVFEDMGEAKINAHDNGYHQTGDDINVLMDSLECKWSQEGLGTELSIDQSSNEWISVEDRLPEVGQLVIAYHPSWKMDILLANFDRKLRIGLCEDHATHWQPLPSPPLEDK